MRQGRSVFRCPICSRALRRRENALCCEAGHSFDIASQGYVHLLPSNRMRAKLPGDSKEMVAARRRFLDTGCYALFQEAAAQIAAQVSAGRKRPVVLDAGCGEGYYSAALYRALVQGGKAPKMAGVDLSKHALRRAAKREKAIEFAVASVYDLPVADRQADLLVNCFSPLALEEFLRVLRPGGLYFYVVPGARHLWELKEVLYPSPYPNEEKLTPYRGLRYLEVKEVDGSIHLPDQQTISDLFQMTPYFWKTPKEGAQRLSQLTELDTTISFRIHVFRKEG